MQGYRKNYCVAGELTLPVIVQVMFLEGELKPLEIVHARGLMREGGSSFQLLIRIAERMNEKGISYRESYLELRNEGSI